MGEFYYDFSSNLRSLLDLWYGQPWGKDKDSMIEISNAEDDFTDDKQYQSMSMPGNRHHMMVQPIEARNSILITGTDREQVNYVKNTLSTLSPDTLPLESLHIKNPQDIAGGALLVPKVVVVATHMPGKLLIDNVGDEGQIDYIYDELVQNGSNLLLVYMGLPVSVYPVMKHMIYHPRMIDLVFPDQPTIRHLAEENQLITTICNTDFTSMQKNLMKEWLSKPVHGDHPVFHKRSYPNIQEIHPDIWSETEVYNRNWHPGDSAVEPSFQSATENHPLANKKKKKKKTKFFKIRKRPDVQEEMLFNECADDLEMEMYGPYNSSSFTHMSV